MVSNGPTHGCNLVSEKLLAQIGYLFRSISNICVFLCFQRSILHGESPYCIFSPLSDIYFPQTVFFFAQVLHCVLSQPSRFCLNSKSQRICRLFSALFSLCSLSMPNLRKINKTLQYIQPKYFFSLSHL